MNSKKRSRNTFYRSTNSEQDYEKHCVIERSVRRSGLSHDAFVRILTQTAFSRVKFWTQTDLERLLLTAETLGLSPLSEDLYVTPSLYSNEHNFGSSTLSQIEIQENISTPLTLVLSIQGWMRLINAHHQFEGVSFEEPESKAGQLPEWMQCTIYRKDRKVPIKIKEYMSEVNSMNGAWITHPRRMLRHKCLIQCAKLAFGFPVSLDIDSENEKSTVTHHLNFRKEGRQMSSKRRPAQAGELKSWLSNQKMRP